MRVLHLSTYDLRGGAARSACHLVQGLRELSCDARMLVKEKSSGDPEVIGAGPPARTFATREREVSLIQRKLIAPHRTSISNTFFSLPAPGWDLGFHPAVQESAVLHLHWVSGFLSPASIAQLQASGRPMVWTLHDARPFTGGCHFTAGCRRFETDCHPCPQLDFIEPPLTGVGLAESLARLHPARITLVAPSRWLASEARRSVLFKNARIEVIPYGTDTAVFRPGRAQARHELGLSPGTVCLLAGADVAGEQRKGFHILGEALALCQRNEKLRQAIVAGKLQIVVFGADRAPLGIDIPARWLGRVDAPADLARWYAASNGFLLPSTEDNLPNTMLESLCCGTPVIGFSAGGIPEAVESGRNGLLAQSGSAAELASLISRFVEDSNLREELQANLDIDHTPHFGLRTQGLRYLALYEQLCQRPVDPVSQVPATGPFEATCAELLRLAKGERAKGRWRKLRHALGPRRSTE